MLATYAATKAYVLSLTESLSEELQGTGVTITTLCPGITATSMLTRPRPPAPSWAAYRRSWSAAPKTWPTKVSTPA